MHPWPRPCCRGTAKGPLSIDPPGMQNHPSTIYPFPPHGWSAPDGLPFLLRKQPIWAAGDTTHLMPVEQGLPWHPVATCQGWLAKPSPLLSLPPMRTLSHPLHSGSRFPLFWLPLLPCCAPPPCLLCSPLSLLVWLPRSVCLCCSSPCLLALLGAPVAHPLLSHPLAPNRTRISHLRTTWTVPCAVGWSQPCCRRGAQLPPLWSAWVPCRGREGGVLADGSLGVRRIWWLLQCSHLMVALCIVVCPVGARLTAVCGVALCPVALLLVFLPSSGSLFFCWHAHCLWCAVGGGGGSMSLTASPCGCRVVPLAVGWYQGHQALLHMSPNLQTDLSLVFVGVVLG